MAGQNLVQEKEDSKQEVGKGGELKDSKNSSSGVAGNCDSVIDISGKILDFPTAEEAEEVSDSIEGLYVYKNVFSLLPRSVAEFGTLRTLKFFANEINLVPQEFRKLVDLEYLQLKVSVPGLNGLNFGQMKSLKELELSKVPPRPSAFPILSEIAALKCLTKLSVCHFSIRYLPPEIGCLINLEYLDLSFNKMRGLPTEITYLNSLKSLKITNNKLIGLPSGLSSLQLLENLDLSNNKLTSLECIELDSMHNLRRLNLQYNKLRGRCAIPVWICCNWEGNIKDSSVNELINSSIEMEVFDGSDSHYETYQNSSSTCSSNHSIGTSSSNRCFSARRSSKGWKRRFSLQQRARQERLNSSRKLKAENFTEKASQKAAEECINVVSSSNFLADGSSSIIDRNTGKDKQLSKDSENRSSNVVDDYSNSNEGTFTERHPCAFDSVDVWRETENTSSEFGSTLEGLVNATEVQDEGPSCESEAHRCNLKFKRQPEGDLNNPKPCKARRPIRNCSGLSCKYSNTSFCSSDDYLHDGFYDAGRDRPFLTLDSYQKLNVDSREVILIDRERDEDLDAITLCAEALINHFKHASNSVKDRGQLQFDNLQIASLLAIFVSDHFGGSDKNAVIERTRKAVSGSNYRKPFVCTCSTGNSNNVEKSSKQALNAAEDIDFLSLCEKSLHSMKARQGSIVVPIGAVQFGVCRHRSLLMKYLCDRMEPRIPCELVRGYLDFSPHAWNVIIIKRGDSWVRMLVDACRPYDIREEADPEYFCRYVPLSRVNLNALTDCNTSSIGSFPLLSSSDEIEKAISTSLKLCKLGSLEAVAKVRTLEVCGASAEEIRNFEFSCLGEVRILNVLKHPCIVEIYGHQISSNWSLLDGKPEGRELQSSILMEHIKGGSLKRYLEKISAAGKKNAPVPLALCIAKNIASALAELHSQHIIHRDIKSENVLIDLDKKRVDGSPVVKLCDFDRAIPLRSYLHSCCIAHIGIPSPSVCVGTPRWMAPEVLQAMHKRDIYGLEVDIWSFGCLLLELLTLRVPYSGLRDSEIHDLLQMGKRPPLTEELEALVQEPDQRPTNSSMAQSTIELDGPDTESRSLRFLIDLYRQCTMENPNDRPSADNLYNKLLAHKSSVNNYESLEQE